MTSPASKPPKLAIVTSRYNDTITLPLRDGAVAEYTRSGGSKGELGLFEAPGAYELIAIANACAKDGRYDAVVCLGCVIKGDTDHDKYINGAVAQGLATITIETGVPVSFGLLTVDTVQQAKDRAGGEKGNKGAEAVAAAIETCSVLEQLRASDAVGLIASVAASGQDKASGGNA